MSEPPVDHEAYRERLGVPLRWWVQGTMMIATFWLAVVVAIPGPLGWAITALALSLLTAAFLTYGGATIVVADGVLRAGRAHIGAAHLGAVESLDAEQARRAAGVDADPRAFLLLRPYLKRAVRVAITDAADPAPYWLLSTRHPDALAGAVTALTGSSRAG